MPWLPYRKQFKVVAMANLWEEEEKATALVIVLETPQTLSVEDKNKHNTLTVALELQLGNEHLEQVFPTQVKTRK